MPGTEFRADSLLHAEVLGDSGILLQVRIVYGCSSVNLRTLSPGPESSCFMGVIYEYWRTSLALRYALMGSAVEPVSF